jgi:O-antigen ligase
MLIFWATIIFSTSILFVTKAIKIYLFTGLIQALYGIYQLFGYTRNWPTYQTLLAGIPMANDRTVDGYFYTGAYSAFRAIGFFSTDVSHFAGYMAGVLILTLSFIISNRKKIFPYVIFILGILSLFFSLSRSGIASFFLFGIPTLFITLKWQKLLPKFNLFNFKLILIIIIISVFFIFNPSYTEDLPNPIEILSSRFEDVFDQQDNGSMGDHVLTRKLGLDAFATHPILGVGSGVNANAWFSAKYQAGWAGSHSYHIDRLGQTGILGLLIEWLLMYYILKYMLKGIRVKRFEKFHKILLIGLFSTYVTIILGNFLYYYYMNDFVWFIMGLGVAMTRLILIEEEKYINL